MLITILVLVTLAVGLPALWMVWRLDSLAWSLMALLMLFHMWDAQYWRWHYLAWQAAYWRDVPLLQSKLRQAPPIVLSKSASFLCGDAAILTEAPAYDQTLQCAASPQSLGLESSAGPKSSHTDPQLLSDLSAVTRLSLSFSSLARNPHAQTAITTDPVYNIHTEMTPTPLHFI